MKRALVTFIVDLEDPQLYKDMCGCTREQALAQYFEEDIKDMTEKEILELFERETPPELTLFHDSLAEKLKRNVIVLLA
jgi:hypothetical protein